MRPPSPIKTDLAFPSLGFGLGLRPTHYPHIFDHWPEVDWFEIISENFMDTDGRPKRNLARIRERYPVVMHGVALSIGTVDPLNSEYLRKLKKLIDVVQPAWISDHLCWTGIAHKNMHDLLPVPYTEEALKHIVTRIRHVQDILERPIALENPSTYLEFNASHIPEAEFIAQMAAESGCYLLLDVNNVYVSSYNHRLDAKTYLDTVPLDKVIQIHLSGHTNHGSHIIDTHDDYVIDEVWALYRYVIQRAGRTINTMVEWDDNIPEFDVLLSELAKAKNAAQHAQEQVELPQLASEQTPYIANANTSLSAAQTCMQQAILNGISSDVSATSWIREKQDFPAAEQLAVYLRAYRYRLFEATAEEYPVLQHYLGAERFDQLLETFVEQTPSDHFNIGRYSAALPGFLAAHFPTDACALEIAVLENAVSQLADPAETEPLTPAHLASMTAEALMESTLLPRTALELFRFQYPVNAYYIAVKEERAPVKPLPSPSFLAVFRHEDAVWRMDLEENEYHLLKKLFSGVSVGHALATLQKESTHREETLSQNLSHWFSRWMRNGLLATAS